MELVSLSVNGTEWHLRDILKFACMEGRFTAVEDSIRRAVIQEFAQQHSLSIDEQEWKAKANEMRQQMGLYSATETRNWLSQRGLTPADLFQAAKVRLQLEQVKRIVVTQDLIGAFYLQHRLSFDAANVSQLVVGTREQAQELLFQLEEGEPFYQLAQRYCSNRNSRYDGGYVGWVSRADLTGEEESFVFGAEAGQTGGPFIRGAGSSYRLLHVWEVVPAELTDELRLRLADLLFEEWLKDAVKRSNIEVRLWRQLAGEPSA